MKGLRPGSGDSRNSFGQLVEEAVIIHGEFK